MKFSPSVMEAITRLWANAYTLNSSSLGVATEEERHDRRVISDAVVAYMQEQAKESAAEQFSITGLEALGFTRTTYTGEPVWFAYRTSRLEVVLFPADNSVYFYDGDYQIPQHFAPTTISELKRMLERGPYDAESDPEEVDDGTLE